MSQDHNTLVKLYNQLINTYSESELRHLCFLLNINYEDLPGTSRKDKARELVTYMERHGRVSELTQLLENTHRGISSRNKEPNQIPQNPPKLPGYNRKMRWFSPFIITDLIILVVSFVWMWNEPGFEPLVALLIALMGLIAVTVYERKDVKIHPVTELFLSLLILIVALVGITELKKISVSQGGDLSNNQAPVIDSIVINPQIVRPGESATIIAVASDPDGDVLVYYWTTVQGKVPPGSRGSQVTYTAPTNPEGGIDTITVTVQDGQGEMVSEKKNIVIEYEN